MSWCFVNERVKAFCIWLCFFIAFVIWKGKTHVVTCTLMYCALVQSEVRSNTQLCNRFFKLFVFNIQRGVVLQEFPDEL